MELLLTEDQKLLRDSAAALAGRHGGPKRLRTVRSGATAFDGDAWRAVAEAGWLSLLVPEADGGAGLSLTELALVAEQCGRTLLATPLSFVAPAAAAIADGDSVWLRDTLVPEIAGGSAIVLPAFLESVTDAEPAAAATRASGGREFRLSGRKTAVAYASAASGFLVNAAAEAGTVLCYIPRSTAGVSLAATRTVDGGEVATLVLNDVQVAPEHVVGGANRGAELAGRLFDTALLGLSAELLGVMGQALDTTVEYLKIRKQFDRPIGSFQALQHRAVDTYVEVEATRSLLFQVCAAAGRARVEPAMASAAKARASAATLKVTKAAIQLHGAIGFTDEHDIGLYLKRAMTLAAQFGNDALHRRRYGVLVGIERAAG
jgi:alkylation response protein AidB-like acyl-CoA dehydrogenase